MMMASVLGLLLLLRPAGPASAQDEQDRGSTFARVRYAEGGLTLQRTGEGDLLEGTPNTPVAPGDGAWTTDGRAEIEFADGSVVLLDGETQITLRNLADLESRYEKTNLLVLEQGSLRIEAPETESGDKVFQVDTDGGSIYLLSGGSFRLDAEGSAVTVSSFRGVAELSGDEGSVLVRSGERASVRRGGAPDDPRPFNTARRDVFDQFCEERARAYLRQAGREVPEGVEESVPQEVVPYVGELSVYGSWHSVPSHGWVWRPVYSAGWGPYYNGHWVIAPTGWVWVSYDPWGWAPYHYGRWAFTVDLGWYWIPGRIWSGAWVSWAVGPSYIGWCPLDYWNRPIFTDVTVVNVTNVYVNRLSPRGWRFAPTAHFGAIPRGRSATLPPDRLPRGTEVVVTGGLPRFNPRDVAGHPEKAQDLARTARGMRTGFFKNAEPGAAPVPFRELERRSSGPRSARPVASPGDRRQVGPQTGGGFGGPRLARPSPQHRERAQRPAPPAPQGPDRTRGPQGQGPASKARPADRTPPRGGVLERLFDGVRRDHPPVAAPSPGRTQPPPAVTPPPQRERPPRPEARPPETRQRDNRPQQESRPQQQNPPPRQPRPPRDHDGGHGRS